MQGCIEGMIAYVDLCQVWAGDSLYPSSFSNGETLSKILYVPLPLYFQSFYPSSSTKLSFYVHEVCKYLYLSFFLLINSTPILKGAYIEN